MNPKPRVLFICTGNSCRSQMAEALLRHIGGKRFEALSAGSRPAGFVHPLALHTMKARGLPTDGLVSKHWSAYADRPIDICITVCDNATAECPVWPGDTVQVHWGLPDPAYYTGSDEDRLAFCDEICGRLERRIEALTRLPLREMAHDTLRARLETLASLT